MEKKYQNIIYERLQELRDKKDKIERQIEPRKNIIWTYAQNNCPHDRDYLKAQNELSALEFELQNLIEQMRPLQKQYYNNENNNQTPIEVKDQYEIPNGLIGVNRDIFNKLGTHRWADDRDLQQMYGISHHVVPWKNHFGFTLKRPKPKPKPKYNFKYLLNSVTNPK
jgi:hypothetical protein